MEKSCGALILRDGGEGTELLLLKHKNGGHWAFPKGHVERGENERQTALREVKEETDLTIELEADFRESVRYSPKAGVEKEVVYFLGRYRGGTARPQEAEIAETRWVEIHEAQRIVSFHNDKFLIQRALDYLCDKP